MKSIHSWNDRKDLKKQNLNANEQKTRKKLKNMKNTIIISADKWGKVIVMNRQEYINQIEEQLNDNNVYEEVKDPINMI